MVQDRLAAEAEEKRLAEKEQLLFVGRESQTYTS